MAMGWWWPLPAWLSPATAWFIFLNVVVGAIAFISRAQGRGGLVQLSPRRRYSLNRRASSAVLDHLRSLSLFSFPSTVSQFLHHPVDTASDETEPASAPAQPPTPATEAAPAEEEDDGSMSMEEAYALVVKGRRQQPPAEEPVAEVDAKAEEFKEELRLQRLNSIFKYTQMLKRRARER